MADIGTAYVKIEPTAKGISKKITGEMGSVGEESGSSFGSGFAKVAGGIGKVVAGAIGVGSAAVGGILKSAVSEFANYEQLVGGVETLFDNTKNAEIYGEVLRDAGKSAEYVAKEVAEASQMPIDTVMKNAANAYETAGMSANDYMETVIGMAAALNNSTGDLQVSADLADMAVTDMADNVNKMGTSMESVQNAYRGFSRGNYTMLDNLALGFAGTKEGMQELLDSAQEISGVEYDISSYADIVEAIHVVQESMGITGTTAREAATTIQGSLSMTKAAWTNLMTGIGSGADLTPLINNLISSAEKFAENLIPVVQTALTGISTMIEQLAPVVADKLPALMDSILPPLISAVTTLIVGLVGALPTILDVLVSALPGILEQLINALISVFPTLITTLAGLIPLIIDAAIMLLNAVISALPEILQALFDAMPIVIQAICDGLVAAIPALVQGAIMLVTLLLTHLPEIVVGLIEAGSQIIQAIIDGIMIAAPMLWDAIQNAISTILPQLQAWWSNLSTNASTKMSELIANIKQWLSQLPEQAAYWVGAMIAKFITFLSQLPSKAQQVWSNFITNLKAFGQKMITEGPRIASEFGQRLIEKLKELPQKLVQIGKDIVEGLKEGIKQAWTSMTDWIKDLADSLIQGFKDNLKIGSPSKVFRDEIGQWIPAGIAQGIEDGIGTINSAMADMTMAVSPAAMGDIQTYTPQSATVQNEATSLYELLSRYLPIIASGENVNVQLDVDGQRLFRVIQQQQARNTQLVGVGANA